MAASKPAFEPATLQPMSKTPVFAATFKETCGCKATVEGSEEFIVYWRATHRHETEADRAYQAVLHEIDFIERKAIDQPHEDLDQLRSFIHSRLAAMDKSDD